MDAFVWDQNFITGVEAVDAQHHVLVDLFNELGRALYRSQGPAPAVREPVLRDIFQRLLAYAEYHFADEEALMRRAGVDARHVAAHGAEHQQFLQQVRDLWSVRALLAAPASCFTSFLNGWLGLHILAMDQPLARQLTALAHGTPAAQAHDSEQEAHLQGAPMPLRLVERLYQGLSAQNDALLQAHLGLEARSRQCAQARGEEMVAGRGFDLRAARPGSGQPPRPVSGTTMPLLKVAQAGVRRTLPVASICSVPVAPCTLAPGCSARCCR